MFTLGVGLGGGVAASGALQVDRPGQAADPRPQRAGEHQWLVEPDAIEQSVLGQARQGSARPDGGRRAETTTVRAAEPETATARAEEAETTTARAAEARSGGQPRSFVLAATGDVLIHSPVYRQAAAYAGGSERAYDFRAMFEQVAEIFETADLSICHLEGPLSRDNRDLGGYPRFSAPRELADDLAWANVDACSTASNHTLDRGLGGVATTLEALDEAGVGHAGANRSAEEAEEPRLYEVQGVTVGHVAATYGVNGLPRPEPWAVDLLADERVADRAQSSRDAGAELVVASLHWGREYVAEPTARQRQLARRLLDDGTVDVVLGHHAHVVQPVAQVDERPVLYGLGNFLSSQSSTCCPAETEDGMIGLVEVTEDLEVGGWDTEVSYVPTWVDRSDYTIVDIPATLAESGLEPRRRSALEHSRNRTMSVVDTEEVGMTSVSELRASPSPHPHGG